MAQSVSLWGAVYSNVPALDVPKDGGGTARFTDVTSTTAIASDVAQGKKFFLADGTESTGTAADPNAHTVKCILSDTSHTRTIQIGSGSRTTMTDGAEYTFNTSDTIIVRVVDGGTIYYNGEQVKFSVGTVSYTFAAPSKDLEISCASEKMYIVENEGATIQPLSVTQNGTYTAPSGVDGYSPVTVNVSGGASTIESLNVTPSTSQQTFNSSSVDGYKPVVVSAMPSGTAGTPSASKGTVSNHSMPITPSVTNVTGYITGGTKTGTAVTVSASELVSGTLSITSSGTKDVTNYASASVSAGTAGTPTASKGTVSNHAVSVTPSVTNTTGFITGSTKTGTEVSVSASELVSGTLSLTDNGTADCTNYASVNVNIPFVTYYTGSSTPSSSLGSDGDIYLKTV